MEHDEVVQDLKRKAHYTSLSPEEREAKLKAKNDKIKATLLARSNEDDYKARVMKRLSRSTEDAELSEVKRILDRFGSSWKPQKRSKWFHQIDRFNELAKLAVSKTVVTVIVVAGQCGVGKSWVCKQLNNCAYISYDKAKKNSYALIDEAAANHTVVVFETPIRSRTHAKKLSNKYNVIYTVVHSSEETVCKQLTDRGSTRLTNVSRMNAKYAKYAKKAAYAGSSSWMVSQLQNVIDGLQ